MSSHTEPSMREYESLEIHVDKCALRYEGLEQRFTTVEQRLDRIDQKVDSIHNDIKKGNAELLKILIATAGTIIAAFISIITLT